MDRNKNKIGLTAKKFHEATKLLAKAFPTIKQVSENFRITSKDLRKSN